MTSLDGYSFLWNGAQSEWMLLRISRQAFSIRIGFEAEGPTLREVAAMRAAVPSFSEMSPSEAFAALKGRSGVNLGTFEKGVARRLYESCKMHGLTVEYTVIDGSGYMPFNEKTSQCLVIEGDSLLEQICKMAIAQGVRVRQVEP